MPSDQDEIVRGLRLAAVAVASAVATATVVIGAGGAWIALMQPATSAAVTPAPDLIRASN